jgi:hypothetical protein
MAVETLGELDATLQLTNSVSTPYSADFILFPHPPAAWVRITYVP